jgi:hypothetical protein
MRSLRTQSETDLIHEQAMSLIKSFKQAGYSEASAALNSIMCLHTSDDSGFWLNMAFGVLQPLVDAAKPLDELGML